MEDKVSNPYLEQFIKLLQKEPFLFPETDYAKTAQYFRRRESLPAEEDAEKLYEYLCRHGLSRKKMPPSVSDNFIRLIEYRNAHLEPFEWHLTDEEYVEKVSQLFEEIKAILQFNHPSIELITRIISVLYGCVPTFDATLCHLWGIDMNAPFEVQLFQFKGIAVSSFIWIVFALTAATIKYDLSNEMREKIDEVNSVIYDALEEKAEEEKKIKNNNV